MIRCPVPLRKRIAASERRSHRRAGDNLERVKSDSVVEFDRNRRSTRTIGGFAGDHELRECGRRNQRKSIGNNKRNRLGGHDHVGGNDQLGIFGEWHNPSHDDFGGWYRVVHSEVYAIGDRLCERNAQLCEQRFQYARNGRGKRIRHSSPAT